MKLSVVVITKNERLDLPGLLRNCIAFADEIVIVDDGSTDETASIARSWPGNIKFIEAQRADDEGFCDLRNRGLEAADGDWLLQVDCDMRVTETLADEIRVAIQDASYDAYRFRLQQFFLNHPVKYGGFQYWNQPWLVRRGKVKWSQKVHERANIDCAPNRIGQLKCKMLHLNDHNFDERLAKNRVYSKLVADQMISQGRKVSVFALVYYPLKAWFRSYVLMFGFLDGKIGFVWGLYQFTGTATVYFYVWDFCHRRARLDGVPGGNSGSENV